MKRHAFLLLFIFLSYGFTNEHYSIRAPKSWSENAAMFGADVMLTSPINDTKAPLSIYIKTHKLTLKSEDVINFITKDLKKEANEAGSTWKKFEIINSGKLQTITSPIDINFVEASFLEDAQKQKIFVAIIARAEYYHYFMFQADEADYQENLSEVKNTIRLIKFTK